MNLLIEKYRPNKLTEVIQQTNITKYLKNNNIPNLLLYGPSGTGKTSTIIALAKQIFKKEFKNRVFEFNASDERGINVVRTKIKNVAKLSFNSNNIKIPNWKLIILDEADVMTYDAQYALRRIMEEHGNTTRFCIICNYYSKIIDPIISRCSVFQFNIIKKNNIIKKLNKICEKENTKINKNVIEEIAKLSKGDMRKAINILQNCFSYNKINKKITLKDFNNIFGYLSIKELEEWLNICINDENKIKNIINNFNNNGFTLILQIQNIYNIILNKNINDIIKYKIFSKLINVEQKLIRGCDNYIQFMRLSYFIYTLFNS